MILMSTLSAAVLPSGASSQGVTTVGAGLAQASGAIDDITKRAGNEANYVVFSGAAEVKLLIESLRISARDVLDDGFGKLNNSQQQLFDNIQKSVQSLSKAVGEPVEQGRQAVEEIHQMADQILWIRESVLLRSSPAVLAPTTLAEVPFTIRGLSLDKGNPRLRFGNVEAKRIELKQQQAIFTVPAATFKFQPEMPGTYSGTVELTVNECSWLVFCKDVPHTYQLAVMTLPVRVAKVAVTYNLKQNQRVYRPDPITKSFGYSTGDLTHMKYVKETQGPHAPGYFIDVESMSHSQTHGKARNRYEMLGLSPAGFTMELCAQSQMHTPFKKRSGEITAVASWREYRMEDVVSEYQGLPPKSVDWSAGLQETLAPATNAISIALDYFDGSRANFIGNGADKYVDVRWNSGTQQLLITPKKPNTIDALIQ